MRRIWRGVDRAFDLILESLVLALIGVVSVIALAISIGLYALILFASRLKNHANRSL